MGNTIQYNGVMIATDKEGVYINGKLIPYKKGMRGNSSTIINDTIFIDGYELKGTEWKRTLRSLFHLFF